MAYLEGYDEDDLARLTAIDAWEVSFILEDLVLPDGRVVGGYGVMDTGSAFQVLGGVANGILDWAEQHRPHCLLWYAQGSRRQRLYDRMIDCFTARGSPWRRLEVDPITGMLCAPETFWLARSPLPKPALHERP